MGVFFWDDICVRGVRMGIGRDWLGFGRVGLDLEGREVLQRCLRGSGEERGMGMIRFFEHRYHGGRGRAKGTCWRR